MTDDGKKKVLSVEQAGSESIRRHYQIKGDANPYARDWQGYFETRQKTNREASHKKGSNLRALWQTQGGKCPVYQQAINKESKWEQHHILPSKEGGTDHITNLILPHPTCHKQLHSNPAEARSIRSISGV